MRIFASEIITTTLKQDIMKTNNITKKEIISTLRTLDRTAIFALYKRMNGQINRSKIEDFIRSFGPTKAVRRAAHEIAFGGRRMPAPVETMGKRKEVVEAVKKYCAEPFTAYTKVPMLGHTRLYLCSPVFGHRDYNKSSVLPIAGNERFCEVLIQYAQKFIKYNS